MAKKSKKTKTTKNKMKNTSDSGSKYSPSVSSTFFSASTEQSDHKETPARQTYTVEAIRSHLPKKATRKTAKTYVVKWLGYPENENTKQDSAQLEKEVPDVIDDYWKSQKDEVQKSSPIRKSSGRKILGSKNSSRTIETRLK